MDARSGQKCRMVRIVESGETLRQVKDRLRCGLFDLNGPAQKSFGESRLSHAVLAGLFYALSRSDASLWGRP